MTKKKATGKKAPRGDTMSQSKRRVPKRGTVAPSPKTDPARSLTNAPEVQEPVARPWRVSASALARADATTLKPLLVDLICAEAARAGCEASNVIVNTEDLAGDGGGDAMTPKPSRPTAWLGDRKTCWQFKAGVAGQPARLRGELDKPLPSATLREGGRFVLVASASVDGEAGRSARLNALRSAAGRLGLPPDHIEVFTSETLARWFDEHPGVAASLLGLPPGCQQIERWKVHPHHQAAWQPSDSSLSAITRYRIDLDLDVPTTTPHLHISGPPGVGKTRLALEICREAVWRRDVLYVENAACCNAPDLLERLLSTPQARAVVFVDEVLADQLRLLNAIVARDSSRLRLVTIGLGAAPPGYSILEHDVGPLTEAESVKLVQASHPALPVEHAEFAARFSSGFPKLARVAASALEKDRALDLRGLLQHGNIKRLLDSLIGDPSRRRSLFVLAALESVGWENQRAEEGRVIAAHLGLDWMQVRADVDFLHGTHGIAPHVGDLRYISPRPLGVLLAVEAWQADSERMRDLYERLPTEAARRAFEQRLRLIAQSEQVEAFAATELLRFRDITELATESGVRRWVAIGCAKPAAAVRYVRRALESASRELWKGLGGGARRRLVWGLEEQAWRTDCFHDAVWSLAHLAVAENETYGNNATSTMVAKFQIFLGGTAAPYRERLDVLDEILQSTDPAYRVLAVKALSRPLSVRGESRMSWDSGEPQRSKPEWRPQSQQEFEEAVVGAFDRVVALAREEDSSDVRGALVDLVARTSVRLREPLVRDRVANVIAELGRRDDVARERLWHTVHDVVSRAERYWKDLGEEDLDWLRALLKTLEDGALPSRIRRAVAGADWDADPKSFEPLAVELLGTPDAWAEVWSWLTSGEGRSGAWSFGEALGTADRDGALLAVVEAMLPGPDRRVLGAYLRAHAAEAEEEWVDHWLDHFAALHPDPDLLVEITWRTGSSSRAVGRVLKLATVGASPHMTEQLSYARWAEPLEDAEVEALIRGLAAIPGHRASAMVLAEGRVKHDSSFISRIGSLVLDLVCDPDLVRNSPNEGYYWQRLARALVAENVSRTAGAILAAHDPRSRDDGWFLEHSTYPREILDRCVEIDAAAVWTELRKYLEEPGLATVYTIGLPPILDRMPRQDVLDWIAVEPRTRGCVAARIIAKSTKDGSLLLDLLEGFGQLSEVSETVHSVYFSGVWCGESSKHWLQVADGLRPLTARGDKPRAARWAKEAITQLEHASERDRRREAEERLRGH